MSERITRVHYIVHRPGDESPIVWNAPTEATARARAARVVEGLDRKKGVRHDTYLTWVDLRRRRYYSARAETMWSRP